MVKEGENLLSRFNKLNSNMNNILLKLMESQNLCKLLNYNNEDPLSMPNIDPTSLLFKNIFPIPLIIDPDEQATSYISVVLDRFRLNRTSTAVKNSLIDFNIICHIKIWKTNSGNLRPFLIMNEIDELFNNKHITGVGKLIFESANVVWINNNYSGYKMSYRASDVN